MSDATHGPAIEGLGAVILCGGESARMGRPKAWLDFDGEALLHRVARRVAVGAWPVVVVASAGQALPALPEGVERTDDARPGRGPLEGLAAGLEAVGARAEAVFATSTDAPFVHPAFIARLEALRREGGYDAVVPRAFGRTHALSAVYATGVAREVRALLDEGCLRLRDVLDRVRAYVADEARITADPRVWAADPELLSLRNVNTPDDLAEALARASARD